MANILIVDDDPDTCALLSRFLELAGHHSVFASNGWEALLAIDSHDIDLVLLDMMMPGMNGETFLKILRNAQNKSDTRVIVVSALPKDEVAPRLRSLGVSAVVPKTAAFFEKVLDLVRRNVGEESAPGR